RLCCCSSCYCTDFVFGIFLLFVQYSCPYTDLHSFPTRRSSDLKREYSKLVGRPTLLKGYVYDKERLRDGETVKSGERVETVVTIDRKSTRLNSSHVSISYAVFCLKKKKQQLTQ